MMPSFDIVSEVDLHQLTNAVDQAGRIVANRFDFKGVDASFVREERVVATGKKVQQAVKLRHGLESDQSKAIVKEIKASKLKVQAQIQGEQVRITGKKRDDLQSIISVLREKDFGLPLQFSNFRD